jgi:NAD(P)-dependent dehydrogenase (short-subunit alcohol dehydrogenase family)
MQRFTDKVVLITGGGTGLGRACAIRLAEEGADIAVAGPDVANLKSVADEVKALGRRALPLELDVTQEDTVTAVMERTLADFGRLDGAVNNAGVSPASMLTGEYDQTIWDNTINVNLRGTFLCLKAELAHMASVGAGAVVNVGSFASYTVPIPGVSPYAASKHAVAGLTKAAARDYAALGIRVNAICPGHMRTTMVTNFFGDNPEAEESIKQRIPMRRIAEPEEVAGSVAFLLSDDASFITGTLLTADGGLSI